MQEIPKTATMYSHLSEQFLRWNGDVLEVYCKYAQKWQPSAIKDFKIARVVNI